MANNKKFFECLNSLFYKKKVEYNKKDCSAYLLSMWLAHDPDLIAIVNKINHLQFRLKDDIIYQYYFDKIPKGRRFIRWTKKEKEDKNTSKIIDSIIEEYNCSKQEAKKILSMIKAIE